MPVVHYDYYKSEDPEDQAEYGMCGTLLPDNGETTSSWKYVTCKRCLRQKERINAYVARCEEHIVRQMGEFVDFVNKEKNREKV